MESTVVQTFHLRMSARIVNTGFNKMLERTVDINEFFNSKYGLGTPPNLNCPNDKETLVKYQGINGTRRSCYLNGTATSWVFDHCWWQTIDGEKATGLAIRLSSIHSDLNDKTEINITSCSFAELSSQQAPAFWCKGGFYHISDCCFYYCIASHQFMSYYTESHNSTISSAQNNYFNSIGFKPHPGISTGIEMHGGHVSFVNNNITDAVVQENRAVGAFEGNYLTYQFNTHINISGTGILCLGRPPLSVAMAGKSAPPKCQDCIFARLFGYHQICNHFLQYYSSLTIERFTFIKCDSFYFVSYPTPESSRFNVNVTYINCITDRDPAYFGDQYTNLTIIDFTIQKVITLPEIIQERRKECQTASKPPPPTPRTPSESPMATMTKPPNPTNPPIRQIVSMVAEEEEEAPAKEDDNGVNEAQSLSEMIQIGGLVFLIVAMLIVYLLSILRKRRRNAKEEIEGFTGKEKQQGVDFART